MVSFLTASATWYSKKQEPLIVFVSAFGAWMSYMKSHEILAEETVHSEGVEIRGPDSLRRKAGLIAGALMALGAVSVCIIAVNSMNFPLLVLGYSLFFTGYVVMHYNWFGEPL